MTKKILFLILLICKKGSKLVDMFLVGRRTQKHLLEINTSPFATVGSDNSSRKTKKTQKTENQEVKDHWEFFTHGRII